MDTEDDRQKWREISDSVENSFYAREEEQDTIDKTTRRLTSQMETLEARKDDMKSQISATLQEIDDLRDATSKAEARIEKLGDVQAQTAEDADATENEYISLQKGKKELQQQQAALTASVKILSDQLKSEAQSKQRALLEKRQLDKEVVGFTKLNTRAFGKVQNLTRSKSEVFTSMLNKEALIRSSLKNHLTLAGGRRQESDALATEESKSKTLQGKIDYAQRMLSQHAAVGDSSPIGGSPRRHTGELTPLNHPQLFIRNDDRLKLGGSSAQVGWIGDHGWLDDKGKSRSRVSSPSPGQNPNITNTLSHAQSLPQL
jgi:chromosome segregation ATPase